jgi:hypothetical protein
LRILRNRVDDRPPKGKTNIFTFFSDFRQICSEI